MSEVVGGITELQLLQAEVTLLQKKLELAKKADKTSVCCARIVSSMNSAAAKDGFLVTEGSAPNAYHSSAGAAGETGCCVVS